VEQAAPLKLDAEQTYFLRDYTVRLRDASIGRRWLGVTGEEW
jgi:hypothetical protein